MNTTAPQTNPLTMATPTTPPPAGFVRKSGSLIAKCLRALARTWVDGSKYNPYSMWIIASSTSIRDSRAPRGAGR